MDSILSPEFIQRAVTVSKEIAPYLIFGGGAGLLILRRAHVKEQHKKLVAHHNRPAEHPPVEEPTVGTLPDLDYSKPFSGEPTSSDKRFPDAQLPKRWKTGV